MLPDTCWVAYMYIDESQGGIEMKTWAFTAEESQ